MISQRSVGSWEAIRYCRAWEHSHKRFQVKSHHPFFPTGFCGDVPPPPTCEREHHTHCNESSTTSEKNTSRHVKRPVRVCAYMCVYVRLSVHLSVCVCVCVHSCALYASCWVYDNIVKRRPLNTDARTVRGGEGGGTALRKMHELLILLLPPCSKL